MTLPPPASRIHLYDPSTHAKRVYIIYFITGNPGLIEYYRTFLTHLYGLVNQAASPSTSIHVFGRSLSGFEAVATTEERPAGSPPYSLQEQISTCQSALEDLVVDVREKQSVQDVRVILMGHSVGSYILLEVIRRVREKAKVDKEAVRIAGGVCLFPTVTHIAQSDSGRKATPLFTLPHFPLAASLLAKALTCLVPLPFFTTLVQKALSFPPDAAHTTASFVKSPHGVHQALHMARDEMREITADAWSTEIWGQAHSPPPTSSASSLAPTTPHPHAPATLRFLFAKKDHWVANSTRDALILARGRPHITDANASVDVDAWKPVMQIDEENGWEHGFCIRQSVGVAERVGAWVAAMIDGDEAR